jgi:hypothetical protein
MSVLVQKPNKTARHPEEVPVPQAFPIACQSSVSPVLLPCWSRGGVSPHTPRRTGTPARWVACGVSVLHGRPVHFDAATLRGSRIQ